MTHTLPTAAHLGLILHRMLVDIRNVSYQPGEEKWINRLADVAEIIPLQFINRHEGYLTTIAEGIRQWAVKEPRARRYAMILDMTEDEVTRTLVPLHNGTETMQPAEPASV
jgi:hypothetical protein